jgi:propionyl-CoA carboxylase alpha chain
VVKIGGAEHRVRIKPYDGGTLAVVNGGELIDIVARWEPGQRLLSATVDGRHRIVQVRRFGRGWELQTRGRSHAVQVLPPHVAELSHHMIEKVPPDLSRLLVAPMPGLLTRLDVKPGDKVEAGQPVAVMEAMKMENILRATKAAKVKATPAKAGDSLAVDQVIVEFE